MGRVRCRRRSSVVGMAFKCFRSRVQVFSEWRSSVVGICNSGVEMLKNMVGRSQREPEKRAQEARNQMERSKTET